MFRPDFGARLSVSNQALMHIKCSHIEALRPFKCRTSSLSVSEGGIPSFNVTWINTTMKFCSDNCGLLEQLMLYRPT
jgi:hypothetical protein